MPPSPEPTRRRLIAAGEDLFARHGVDNVSLRELSRASGTRNSVALQHHFGDRNGLLRAILVKHLAPVELSRQRLLDACSSATPDIRSLSGALVNPLADRLHEPDGGPAFLQIYAEVVNRDRAQVWPPPHDDRHDSMARWRSMVEPLMPEGATLVHRRFSAVLYVTVALARRARTGDAVDAGVLTNSTIDVVAATLTAPVSAQTVEALHRRGRHAVAGAGSINGSSGT